MLKFNRVAPRLRIFILYVQGAYTNRLPRPFSPTSCVGFNLVRPHYIAASRLSGPFTNPLPAVISSIFYAQMDVMPKYPTRVQGTIARFHYIVDPPFDPK